MKQILGSTCYVTEDGKILNKHKQERKAKLSKTGYLEVDIYYGKDIGKKYFRVHRLVAQHYIENPENKPFVNHKDGNKTNNAVSNLEWVTHQENMEHAKNFGLIKRAEENSMSILKTSQAEEICKLLQMGYRNIDIAKSLGVSSSSVSSIRYGVTWMHISCKYNIPDRSRSLSTETIHWLCSRIQEGLTQGEILSLGYNQRITKTLIKDVRRKRIYKDISSQYKF